MKRIVLVDDEILVRVGIKSIMDWEKHGYQIVGEASDGKEALEVIKKEMPDIVLTDLIMDVMDGIELIKELERQYPQIIVIVLSCNNDYENVRHAMKLGALDYMFKLTLKEHELLEVLKEAEKKKQRVETDQQNHKYQGLVQKNIEAIKGKLLIKIKEESYISTKHLYDELDYLGLDVNFLKPYRTLVVSVNNYYKKIASSEIREADLLNFSIKNIISEIFMGKIVYEIFDDIDGRLVIIVENDTWDKEYMSELLSSVYKQLNQALKRYLNITVSIGVSSKVCGIESLVAGINEANLYLDNRFFVGNGLFDQAVQTSITQNIYKKNQTILMKVLLNEMILSMNEDVIYGYIKEYMDVLKCKYYPDSGEVINKLLEMAYNIKNILKNIGIPLYEVTHQSELDLMELIRYCDNSIILLQDINEIITIMVEIGHEKALPKQRSEIIVIKKFVFEHMDQDIDIAMAAQYINMSESYFSHFFKKETGESFIAYINRMKMSEAKKMLMNKETKVYEVADNLGYMNTNYFSLLFKKIVGMSPRDFRHSQNSEHSSKNSEGLIS